MQIDIPSLIRRRYSLVPPDNPALLHDHVHSDPLSVVPTVNPSMLSINDVNDFEPLYGVQIGSIHEEEEAAGAISSATESYENGGDSFDRLGDSGDSLDAAFRSSVPHTTATEDMFDSLMDFDHVDGDDQRGRDDASFSHGMMALMDQEANQTASYYRTISQLDALMSFQHLSAPSSPTGTTSTAKGTGHRHSHSIPHTSSHITLLHELSKEPSSSISFPSPPASPSMHSRVPGKLPLPRLQASHRQHRSVEAAASHAGYDGVRFTPIAPQPPLTGFLATHSPATTAASIKPPTTPKHKKLPLQHKTTDVSISTEPKQCYNCLATDSPQWRHGEQGRTMCNACGIHFKTHGYHRDLSIIRPPRRGIGSSTDASVGIMDLARQMHSVWPTSASEFLRELYQIEPAELATLREMFASCVELCQRAQKKHLPRTENH